MYIITEGENTEPSYFENIVTQLRDKLKVKVKIEIAFHSSIFYMLKKARAVELESGDEVWIVLDRDENFHHAEDMKLLADWEKESKQHHVALTNPRFEFWLLLHFEESPSKQHALSDSYLEEKGYIPNFFQNGKRINSDTPLSLDLLQNAIRRAKKGACPTPQKPDCVGSGMYKLMLRLMRLARGA